VVEKGVDLMQEDGLFGRVERGRDAEDPDVGVVAELIDVYTHAPRITKLRS
jgi:hypothetical protein